MLCLLMAGLAPASAVTLEVAVRPTFNGDPLRLDSLSCQNGAGETLSVTRLSYLLSGLALQREDGGWVELADRFGWMDAAKQRTALRIDDVPPGQYRALRFHLGPDARTNAADAAQWPAGHPLNTNLDGLYWSMQGGYIFLAMEGRYRSVTGELKGFSYHLARDPNRVRISLAGPLDLDHDASVQIDFDLAALLNAPRPLSFAKDGAATHSRDADPVAAALVANLPGAFHVRQMVSSAPAITRRSPLQPLYLPETFTPYRFTLSRTFPIPALPRDNPLLEERVALGDKLFHEPLLSRDSTISCSSCHDARAAFSDPRRFSLGVDARAGTRHAMPLFNLAWKTRFFWDGRAASLREQVLVPIQDPAEMDETPGHVVAKLSTSADYRRLFKAAFGTSEISADKLGLAIENYLLTLTAFDAPFDRAMSGKGTLSAEARRGFELFMTEYEPRTGQRGADCFHCHGGPLFSDNEFHNNGLEPNPADTGRHRVTGMESDRYKFATPSLRNLTRTAPYMHDGRFTTLEQVVAHYSTGIHRSDTLDPNLAKHPAGGLQLSQDEQRALVAFLKTLSE